MRSLSGGPSAERLVPHRGTTSYVDETAQVGNECTSTSWNVDVRPRAPAKSR
jgi:hypothetical protein